MPVITLEAGKLNKEQKSQLVKEFTATASKLMNVPELKMSDYGITSDEFDKIATNAGETLGAFLQCLHVK